MKQSASRFLVITWLFLGVSVLAVPANGLPVPNLTGTWALMVTETSGTSMCMWKGPMLLAQTGMDFTGSCMLEFVSGGECPSMLSGNITGSIGGSGSGFTIDFGLASGPFGMATFSGIVSLDGQSASGMWDTNDSASGIWSAEKQLAQAAPAMSGIALVVLGAMLTVAGVVRARRRAL